MGSVWQDVTAYSSRCAMPAMQREATPDDNFVCYIYCNTVILYNIVKYCMLLFIIKLNKQLDKKERRHRTNLKERGKSSMQTTKNICKKVLPAIRLNGLSSLFYPIFVCVRQLKSTFRPLIDFVLKGTV